MYNVNKMVSKFCYCVPILADLLHLRIWHLSIPVDISTQPTLYEEEEEHKEEDLYESLHPREEAPTASSGEEGVPQLPRGQR